MESVKEWWIVETKTSFFIYEDETIAEKERVSQAAAYGYAEVHHAKSDYDLMAQAASLSDKFKKEVLRLRIENEALKLAADQFLKAYLVNDPKVGFYSFQLTAYLSKLQKDVKDSADETV